MRVNLRTLLIAFAALAAVLFLWPRQAPTWSIRNARPGSGAIVCFGDSLTRGHGATAEESYPAVLASLLGREILNRGRDGETSETALERLDGDVLGSSPSVVIITLGGNDMLRRLPIEDTLRSLRKVFERILAAGAMVVFLPIDPPFVSDERMKRVKELCRELGVLYVDSVMNGMWGNRRLMSDGIHPNAAGYRVMAERVRDALEKRL
jgi:lysophospholipase L1-like esterase